jgi:hypothetical protein
MSNSNDGEGGGCLMAIGGLIVAAVIVLACAGIIGLTIRVIRFAAGW